VPENVHGNYIVAKADDDLQLIFGWANVTVETDGTQVVDAHAEVIDTEELELAAYEFVLTARHSGEDHDPNKGIDGALVESMMFTPEKREALARSRDTGEVDPDLLAALEKALPDGWWVGFHLPDREAYQRARTAKTMFSIEGRSQIEEIV
jgi:hypothetical protein